MGRSTLKAAVRSQPARRCRWCAKTPKTASGAIQSFYRKPTADYRLVYETRRKLLKRDVSEDEAHCRAYEWAVSVFRDNHRDASLEDAKAAVLAAIKRSSTKETAQP